MNPWPTIFVAHQAPLSMGFPRQEYWSGLPRPPPGDLPNSGIEPRSPALRTDSLLSELPSPRMIQSLVIPLEFQESRTGPGRLKSPGRIPSEAPLVPSGKNTFIY